MSCVYFVKVYFFSIKMYGSEREKRIAQINRSRKPSHSKSLAFPNNKTFILASRKRYSLEKSSTFFCFVRRSLVVAVIAAASAAAVVAVESTLISITR